MAVFVLGDVHGAHRALVQVFERSGFDYENDTLIFLGDVCDGWSEVKECIDELLKVKNLVHLLGNHDEWALDWINTGYADYLWIGQGGRATWQSYGGDPTGVPLEHIRYLRTAKLWHQEGNRIFVHGGWPIDEADHPVGCHPSVLNWDRSLWNLAVRNTATFGLLQKEPPRLTQFDEVYVGHTPTYRFSQVPTKRCEVWNLDQGAGWDGVLSIMNIDTKEYWQSDAVKTLYPEEKGRFAA